MKSLNEIGAVFWFSIDRLNRPSDFLAEGACSDLRPYAPTRCKPDVKMNQNSYQDIAALFWLRSSEESVLIDAFKSEDHPSI